MTECMPLSNQVAMPKGTKEASQGTVNSQTTTGGHVAHETSTVDEFSHLQASRAMKESLRKLRDELRCTLCGDVYQEPMTLSCAHSFCKVCIDDHSCNSWVCPYPDCQQAFSMQTCGSFRKINPTLQSLVTSLHVTLETLKRAPPDWWKEGGDTPGPFEEDFDSVDNEEHDGGDDDDDDESIDLQQS